MIRERPPSTPEIEPNTSTAEAPTYLETMDQFLARIESVQRARSVGERIYRVLPRPKHRISRPVSYKRS